MTRQTRRTLLKRSVAAAGGLVLARPAMASADAAGRVRLPVAGVTTVYSVNSHSDVILGKILEGFQQEGGPGPELELVSLYVEQFPDNDVARRLVRKHGFRLAKTIDEAVNLGGDDVGVAGVLHYCG